MAGIDTNSSVRNALYSGVSRTGGPDATQDTNKAGSGVNSQGGPVPPSSSDNRFSPSLSMLFDASSNRAGSEARLENSQNAPTLAEFESALKALLSSVRDPDMLAKLMIEMSSMSRQNALDARLQARSQARSELEGQAGETREAAQKMLVSAIVGLIMAVVSLAVSVVGAAMSGSASKDAASNSKDAIKANKLMDETDNLTGADKLKLEHKASGSDSLARISNTKADSINQVTGALTGFANALKGALEGSLNASAKMDEADGQMLAAAAQDSQANADMAKQFMDELQELIRSALQFLKDMQQAETDMMATASRL